MDLQPPDEFPPEEPCDHEWEMIDESFDHEFGTEQVHFWRCAHCDKEMETKPGDFCDNNN